MKRILLLSLFCVTVGALVFFARATNVPPCTPASISQPPASQTDCQGSTASFTVTASGSTPLNYQWQKNNNSLNDGGNISGSMSQTLVISNITTSDAASYIVVVANSCGIVTSTPPAVLTVNIPPSISPEPQSQTVTLGSNVTFSVSASGTQPLNYQWYFDWNLLVGATNTSLTLTNVQLTNAGSYSVVVVSSSCGGVASSNAVLTVMEPPYLSLSGGLTNYTFKGDTTYYITGTVNLYGATTFEGGAVIKYDVGASLNLNGNLNWLASSYRPVIFTGKDDNSVGGAISGSTGNPTNYYASPALGISSISPTPTLSNLRIICAQLAVQIQSCNPAIADAQFVNCQSGLALNNAMVSLRNALFSSVQTNFISTTSGIVNAQNVTFSGSGCLGVGPASPDGSGLILTNCILANVTNLTAGVLSTNGSCNGFYNSQEFGTNPSTNSSYPFRTAGAGNYYLASGCTFTNAGTTNIDAILLADLQKKTTYPPTVLSNITVPVSTTLNPAAQGVVLSIQAQRDTDTPDLGYHYDPLDYITDLYAVTNAVLTVNTGTAIACYNETGIELLNGSSITSIGTPLAPNWFVRYQSVQEQPILLSVVPNNPPSAAVAIIPNHVSTNAVTGMFRFSKFACPSSGGWHLYNNNSSNSYNGLFVQDCELWNGSNDLSGAASTTVTLKNNLFARSDLSAISGVTNYTLSLTNNLFWNAPYVTLFPSSNSNLWSIFNNDFDNCAIATSPDGFSQATVNGYNAYINCNAQLYPTNANNVVTNAALVYQTGWLGSFYQPTNSPLFHVGSTTAGGVGLYHYTVTTNQVVDGTNTVSIGYHYLTVDQSGNLLSTGGSGVLDYIADANGDGIYDAGDVSDWTKFSTDGSGMSDSWEIEYFGHIGVDPNADPDCDGRSNLQEFQDGTQPMNNDSAKGLLNRWSFNPPAWLTDLGYAPVSFTNLNVSALGDGNALVLDSTNAAWLQYNVIETNGATNLTVNQGTVMFWFAPNWSGINQGGTGPGVWGRLIEVGACTTNSSYGWWSLYVDPAGANIYFSAQTNNNSGTTNTYFSAPISWKTGRWHLLMLTYTATNSALYMDGALATNGSGVTKWPGTNVLAKGFYVGSDSNGVLQAHGMFDDLSTYNYVLATNTVQNVYSSYQTAYYGNPMNPANLVSAPSGSPTPSSVFNGPGYLKSLGSSGNCVTSSNVWITNVVFSRAANNSMTFTFAIAGGAPGVPYDVFSASVLTGPWSWMGQGYSCTNYAITNLPTTIAFFILGTPQDTDRDGLTDAYEKLVSHTDPNNPDTDGDGVNDGQEILDGTDPLNPNSVAQVQLGYWRFDNTNTWVGDQGQLPLLATNVVGVPGWFTNAVLIDSTNTAVLKYRDVETNGYASPNINCRNGTVSFWFAPDWNSSTGPGCNGRLIEMGTQTTSNGWWSLYFNTNGTQLVFGTQTNGLAMTNLTASVNLVSNQWYQIALTYSPSNSTLYLDGQPWVTNGLGTTYYPNRSERAAGFRIGSDANGTNQARGTFDELEIFNYPLAASDITTGFATTADLIDSDQNGLPDWWQILYFGHLGVDPYADPDNDGWNNLQEFQNGTNPTVFNTPPTPTGIYTYVDSTGTNVLVSWNPSPGLVTNYIIGLWVYDEDTDEYSYQQVAEVNGNITSFEDVGGFDPNNYNDYNSYYVVQAVYAGGSSLTSGWEGINFSPPAPPSSYNISVTAQLMRNQSGHWQLMFSGIPSSVETLKLHWYAYDYWYDINWGNYDSEIDLPASSFTNGVYVIPDSQTTNQIGSYGGMFGGAYGFMAYVQPVDTNNHAGNLAQAGFLPIDAPCFVDGRQHLKQNLLFSIRAATISQPADGYVESSIFRQALQWKDWYNGAIEYTAMDDLWPFTLNYQLHQRLFDLTYNGPSSFVWQTNLVTVPAPAVLGIGDPYWISQGLGNLVDVAAYTNNGNLYLQSGANNLFGLAFKTALVNEEVSTYEVYNNGQWVTVTNYGTPITVAPGNSTGMTNVNCFFSQTADPVLLTNGYYFATVTTPGTMWPQGAPLNQPNPIPVNPGFAATNQTGLMIASVGNPTVIGGWDRYAVQGSSPTKYAYLGQYFVTNAFLLDGNGNATTNIAGILSPYGEFFPLQAGAAALVTMPDIDSPYQQGTGVVKIVSMNADANHDGVMDFSYSGPDQTSPSRPFRFWVNDDQDAGDDTGTGIPGQPSSIADGQNYTDQYGHNDFDANGLPIYHVHGRRDLVDFFPVYLNVGSLFQSNALSAGISVTDTNYQFVLSQADGALRFAYTDLTPTNYMNFLQDTNESGSLAYAPLTTITANGVALTNTFVNAIATAGQGVILVEAWESTTQPLVLSIYHGTNQIAQTSLYLSISGVEQMFRHKNLLLNTAGEVGLPSDRLNDWDVPNEPDTIDKNFVFLHGYNVLPNEARGVAADMFKRMYWSGSHAKFYAVTWEGADTQGSIIPNVTGNFHSNVFNAFSTAPALNNFLNSLSGTNIVAAHSLGNMVVLDTLNDYTNQNINTYFMLDAAVPIEAIDGSAATDTNMVHSDWNGYDSQLWASEWHSLFPTNDARSTLTWRDRFSNFNGADVYNFYSSGEEVLRTYTTRPTPDFTGMAASQIFQTIWNGRPIGSFVWCYQELLKGRMTFDVLGSKYGGWGFNIFDGYFSSYPIWYEVILPCNCSRRAKTPTEIGTITTNLLDGSQFNPLFKTGWGAFNLNNASEIYVNVDSANFTGPSWILGLYQSGSGNTVAADSAKRARLLADEFPALTLPVGANPVSVLGANHNFNMSTNTFQNGWPMARSTGVEAFKWYHSDFHQVAYTFTYKLFNQFVTTGNLK